jgi:CheY-like chemotaxis protein
MAPQTPVKILLIDDEASFVRALAQLLHRDGYTVHTAANGQHALAQLRTQCYDVILCDLYMPTLDGPTLYALLRQQSPDLCQRMIFVTGDTLGVESTAFLAQCGQPCLYKPCTAADVRDAIQQRLGLAASAETGVPGAGGTDRGASMPEEGMLSILQRGNIYQGHKCARCRQTIQSAPAFDDDLWYHRTCLEEGQRALQRAQELATRFRLESAAAHTS